MTRSNVRALSMLTLALTACGAGGGAQDAARGVDVLAPSDAAAALERVTIRASEGGMVRSSDGLFELYVPPGALASDTEITVRRLESGTAPADVAVENPLSAVYSVEPDGLRFAGEGAYAHFRFDATPARLVTTEAGVARFASVTARTRPASSGPGASQLDTLVRYGADGGGVDVMTRVAHLSLHWVAEGERQGSHFQLAPEFGERQRAVGARFDVRTAALVQLGEGQALPPTGLRAFASAQTGGALSNANEGVQQPRGWSAYSNFGLPSETATAWAVTVEGATQYFAPAPSFVCDSVGANASAEVCAQFSWLEAPGAGGVRPERFTTVCAVNAYECGGEGPSPRDAGLDAIADDVATPRLDAATRDAGGADVSRVDGACRDGACGLVCDPNHGDCDGNRANGCEADLRVAPNCGACGRAGVEVCDGVDNDCDGRSDEGCPVALLPTSGPLQMGPAFGGSGIGETGTTAVGTPAQLVTGLCGSRNADGSIRQLRAVLSDVSLVVDRGAAVHTFSIAVAESEPPCEAGTTGGVAGGVPWSLRCPAGYIADTLAGNFSDRVSLLRLRCAQWTVSRGGSDGGYHIARGATQMTAATDPGTGASSGTPFSWSAPDDAITGAPGALRSIAFRYSLGLRGAVLRVEPRGGWGSIDTVE